MSLRDREGWRAYEVARDAEKEALDAIDAWAARESEGVDPPYVESVQRVRARLGPQQALVLYALAPDEARAIVVTRDASRLVSLGDAYAIRRAVAALELGNSGDPRVDHRHADTVAGEAGGARRPAGRP